ncbi:MAG: mechanosensitive ion channel [Alphaproteobacteria bacterium]|nr:mechanosensitive ion channel [Alphaproteobacteria bacterium]
MTRATPLSALLAAAFALVSPLAALAQTAPAPLTPAQAQQALELLQDPVKRAQLIATLQALATAAPGHPAANPPARAAPPRAAAAGPASPEVQLAPNGLGAELLREGSHGLAALSTEAVATARDFAEFPMLWRWAHDVAGDPAARAGLVRAGWRLLLALGIGIALERLAALALRRARRLVVGHGPPPRSGNHDFVDEGGQAAAEAGETEHREPRPSPLAMLRRVPFVLMALLIDAVPLGAFFAGGYAALALVAADQNTRLVIVAAIQAYLTWRVVLLVARIFLAPAAPRLRLFHIGNAAAAQVVRWVGLIAGVALFGRAASDILLLQGLYPAAQAALFKLIMLVAHLLAAAFVLRNRAAVARYIRARPEQAGVLAAVRNRLAAVWHLVAIFYIVAIWLVWALQVRDGYSRLLHFFVVTTIILLLGRLLMIVVLGGLDRALRVRPDIAARFPELQARAHRYRPALRAILSGLIWVATILALCQGWGVAVRGWFVAGALGGRAAWAAVVIALTVVLAILVWEAANLAMQRHLRQLTESGQGPRAARIRTLLPILRAMLLVAVGLLAGLTALSEIGVNIGPLLAGAGIVGVAIGFGSQKLVQDFITGIFLLFENAMQVGDAVTVAGLSGTVENLSIRTLRLRGGDGSIYLIPFSAVTTVNNTNRGLGNAAVSVNVALGEDIDRVARVLQEIAAEMRKDPAYQRQMLGELELWGVDKVDGAAVTLAGQIVCTDAGRWPVQREFNRRMKMRFQELGIALATPVQTVVLRPPPGATEVRGEAAAPAPIPFTPPARGAPR